jgi:hypothetical protein
MMTTHVSLPHWNYFRLLERDLEQCFQFVAPSPDHYVVHSDRFAQIILLACAEIENVMRAFSVAAGCVPVPSGIGAYQQCVLSKYSAFRAMKVSLPRFSLVVHPWANWTPTEAPDWWTFGYNKIKHDRMGHPGAPSMHRAISSVAALLVILLHYYTLLHGDQCAMPFDMAPTVFDPVDEQSSGQGGIFWSWRLPRSSDA